MAKRKEIRPDQKLRLEEKKRLVDAAVKKTIIVHADLRGKLMIYAEDEIDQEGNVDFIQYYIDKRHQLTDPDVIVYVDRYSAHKRRERLLSENKKKRARVN